jgi:HTH-type transcriptional regulator, competence development regulator
MTSAVAFGRRLRQERSRQGKSMDTLAREGGTHASTLSLWERGQRDPRLSTMVRLAAALEVPLCELVRAPGPIGGGVRPKTDPA